VFGNLLLPLLWTPLPKPKASVTTLTLPPKPLQDCTTNNRENQPILKLNLPSSQSKPTQVISSSDTHNNKPLSEKQPIRDIDTVQQRARNILEFSSMPLVPHTRRNWDRDEVLKLEGTIISWPPYCILPSIWSVTCQNTVCYDQVYDLLLVRMLYVTNSNSYIYINCCVHIVFYQVYELLLVIALYVTTKYYLVYDLLLVRTPYVTISNSNK
jgi:hypothetical protein